MKVTEVTVPFSWPWSSGTMSTSSGRMTTSTASSFSKPLSRHWKRRLKISTTPSERMMPSMMLDSPMKSATKALRGSL